ncbi:hypothetical protein A2U01_0071083, partial [Trifolium medium]|nr:hypothetical protein [Trifolium medium]
MMLADVYTCCNKVTIGVTDAPTPAGMAGCVKEARVNVTFPPSDTRLLPTLKSKNWRWNCARMGLLYFVYSLPFLCHVDCSRGYA